MTSNIFWECEHCGRLNESTSLTCGGCQAGKRQGTATDEYDELFDRLKTVNEWRAAYTGIMRKRASTKRPKTEPTSTSWTVDYDRIT